MAHFAKLDSNNIVERVEVVNNDVATDEEIEPLSIAKLLKEIAEKERPDLFILGKQMDF